MGHVVLLFQIKFQKSEGLGQQENKELKSKDPYSQAKSFVYKH